MSDHNTFDEDVNIAPRQKCFFIIKVLGGLAILKIALINENSQAAKTV